MKKTKGFFAFALIVSTLLVGTVMALPTITVTVQQAAMGDGQITAPVSQANVNLVPSADGQNLDKVNVKFDQDLQAGATVYVYVLDKDGAIIDSGSTAIQEDTAAGSEIEVDLQNDKPLQDVAGLRVIVFGPQV